MICCCIIIPGQYCFFATLEAFCVCVGVCVCMYVCMCGVYVCVLQMCAYASGGFRNLERGVQSEKFGCHAHFRSRWKPDLNPSQTSGDQ